MKHHTVHHRYLIAAAMVALTPIAAAGTHIWTGGAPNDNWSSAANWSGGVPAANEAAPVIIEFPATFTGPSIMNVSGLTVDTIRFLGSGQALTGAAGATLTLRGGGAAVQIQNSGLNRIQSGLGLALGGATRTFDVADGCSLTVSAVISSGGAQVVSGGIIKSGPGRLILAGNNTYVGDTMVNEGTLEVRHVSGLGSNFMNNTSVTQGAVLELTDGVILPGEALTLDGGTLRTAAASAGWGGPVTLSGYGTFDAASASSELQVLGVVSGSGWFQKAGIGRVLLGGSEENTFTGWTMVNQGELRTAKPDGVAAVSWYLACGDDQPGAASVRLLGDAPSGHPRKLRVNSDGAFHVNGHECFASELHGSGSITLGLGTLHAGYGDFAGSISGIGVVRKSGDVILRLTGSNPFTGVAEVAGGPLIVDGSLAASLNVLSDGWLGGRGVTGAVTVNGGTISAGGGITPGAHYFDVATMQTGNLELKGAARFRLETRTHVSGGWERDQIKVAGTVKLTDAILDLQLGFAGAANIGYLLIDNDGTDAVQGTFQGMPEGHTFTHMGAEFQITYVSGTGNDVVLRQRSPSTADFTVTLDSTIVPDPGDPQSSWLLLKWPAWASNYRLEASADLHTWEPGPGYVLANSRVRYAYPSMSGIPRRFFRLVMSPP